MSEALDSWQRFVAGSNPNGSISPLILESWRRSLAAGVDPTAELPKLEQVADQDFQGRLWANASLLAVAQPLLELASASLAAVPHAVYVTDRQGVVLHNVGSLPLTEARSVLRGESWSEERIGTNAAGTALAAHQPVAVFGPEHFQRFFHDLAGVGAPVCDPPDEVVGAVGILTSIDDGDRHRLELASYLARTMERELANQRAKGVLHNKEEFLEQLVHELRNPMAALLNFLHLIRLSAGDQVAVTEARQSAERQVHDLANLLNDLLDISRISGGHVYLQKKRVAVDFLVREAVNTTRPQLETRQQQLTELLPPGPLFLQADPVRIIQVLTHLLAHAAKYTGAGGHIWVSAERDGNDVLLSVYDNGVGLPVDLLPKAFDLFLGKTAGPQKGLRIGLNLARSLVELHGGSILALSDGPGEGSEFIVRLPAAVREEPCGTVGAAGEQPGAGNRSWRVLVVDDDIDVADSLSRLLKLWQYEVQVAHEGFAALEVARTWKPEVILLDIGLPGGLDGFQVARGLRAEVGLRNAVIVAMTGYGHSDDLQESIRAGFDHHLIKPVEPESLRALLAESERSAKTGHG
jgi:signal transduction histidine kinase/CheY-like chemotaxis protein